MNKNFNLFMSQLQETNQTLDFFCDFDKISANVADVEISLNSLNYLIGRLLKSFGREIHQYLRF